MSDLYFGYGSNLNVDDWKDYAKRNNLDPDSIKAIPGIFFLPDYELAFDVKSGTRNGGVLDVIPKPGHAVVGKLFEVFDNYTVLNRKEGHPNFYKSNVVTVLDENGMQHKVTTYVVCQEKKQEFVKPTEEYLEIVLKGYVDFGISKKYPWAKKQLQLASKNKVNSSGVDHVFTYGTLCQGECREKSLLKFSEKKYLNQTINGSLIDLKDYPGLIVSNGVVYGELHHTPNISETVKELDRIEGFSKYNDSSLFCRILTQSGGISCWTYLWNGDSIDKQIIESGNWVKFNKDR